MNTRANARRAQYTTGATRPEKRATKTEQTRTTAVPTPNFISTVQVSVDPIVDIDVNAKSEDCGPYCKGMYSYLRYLESKHQIASGKELLENCQVKAKWRVVLVDWMREITLKLRMMNETFYLAVALLDRFFDRSDRIPKQEIQIAGLTALFIAAKYEEIYPPSVDDLADLSDGAYTVKQVLRYELHMFELLDYDLSQPYAIQFLRRIASTKKDAMSSEVYNGAKYLIELSVLDLECIGVPTSAIAAAALKTSCKVFGYKWDKTLTHYSDYTSDELDSVVSRLFYLTQKAYKTKLDSPFGKQRKRYSSPLNDSVAQKFI